jgi:hypothetical protein
MAHKYVYLINKDYLRRIKDSYKECSICTMYIRKIKGVFCFTKRFANVTLHVIDFEYFLNKRYFRIDQHLARQLKYNGACLSSPPSFLCSQIVTLSSNSMISKTQDKEL